MYLLIKGGKIVDPVGGSSGVKDILIKDGRIDAVDENLEAEGAEIVDASGKLVLPGLIDMHVHLREPGFEAKETIETGTAAATAGGFTAVACMPNTNPVADNASVIEFILDKAARAGNAAVYPVGAITAGSRGEMLAQMSEMKEAGAVAVSDDGRPVSDAGVMRRAMQYASMLDLPVISHCENLSLSAGGVMHEGIVSTMLGLKGIPPSAEETMIARDIILAGETGCRLHIAHVSTENSVRMVREAKERGMDITAEAAPHHFTLTHEAVMGYDTSAKVNPPLRTEADVQAVREGLADGTIDVISTDHAPHTEEEKDVEYDLAPFGIPGLETAVGLVWNELVHPGFLTIEDVAAKMSVNPAKILGVNGGQLKTGEKAEITIIDPGQEWEVLPEKFESKGKRTPFAGTKLKGKVAGTIFLRHSSNIAQRRC